MNRLLIHYWIQWCASQIAFWGPFDTDPGSVYDILRNKLTNDDD